MTGPGFDRDFTLGELLRGVDGERLIRRLADLAGTPVRLLDANETALLSRGEGTAPGRVPLAPELEPVGFLEGPPGERLRAAAAMLEWLLRANHRYLMASELHLDAVHRDYEELQRKHAALEVSEARYRALNEQLEQRVAEQVRTIDATTRRLYHNEKLAAVGQLAAGVAHEINNPLGFIRSNLNTGLGYLERLRALTGDGPAHEGEHRGEGEPDFLITDFGDLLRESLEGATRVAEIVSALKGLSGVDRMDHMEPVDINTLIRQICQVMKGQTPAQVRLGLDLAPLPAIRCSPGRLSQVFINLQKNALQAVDGGGVLRWSTSVRDERVRVRLEDDGPGIAPEAARRLFEPFFTTREVGAGRGLGLALSLDIVRDHGGDIEAHNRPGGGAAFTVYLPVAQATGRAASHGGGQEEAGE